MSFAEFLKWAQLAQAAVPAGAAAVAAIKAAIELIHGPQMSDSELNAAYALLFNEESRRLALALADAKGQ